MAAWRRLLCIVLGMALAVAGLALLSVGTIDGVVFLPGLYLTGLGGILTLSGIAPRAARRY